MLRNPRGALTAAVVIVAALLAPRFLSPFWIRILTGTFMWVALAQSWNVIGGYTGYLNFGHGAFFGVGAYATAILMMHYGVEAIAAWIVSGFISAALAFVVGIPTLRLKGAYFAIATWAFAEMIKQLSRILKITGGAYGMRLPPLLDERFFYYAMLAALALTMGVIYFTVERAMFGYQLRAIRENEQAAETLGIATTAAKLKAFTLSGFFPGLIGGIYAYWITYIHPESVLQALISDRMVIMVLLGGIGTFLGPIIGGTVLYLVERIIWVVWGETVAYIVIIGVVICLVVLYMPNGIMGVVQDLFQRRNRRPAAAPAGESDPPVPGPAGKLPVP